MCYLGATYIYEKKRPEGRFFEPLPGLEDFAETIVRGLPS